MAEIRVVQDLPALYREGAHEFLRAATRSVNERGAFYVALAGGSTPRGMFSLLVSEAEWREKNPWRDIHFFWGDERHVPPEHPDSNYRMANDALFAHVSVPAENIHRIPAELTFAAQAAEEYERELVSVFALQSKELPRFDLVLLGMGAEGHTASLFPGTKALHETNKLVAANWVGKLYKWRITLTAPVINRARNIVFIVSGQDKALALKGVLEGPVEPDQLPAQLISPTDGQLLWLLDEAAAGALNGRAENHG